MKKLIVYFTVTMLANLMAILLLWKYICLSFSSIFPIALILMFALSSCKSNSVRKQNTIKYSPKHGKLIAEDTESKSLFQKNLEAIAEAFLIFLPIMCPFIFFFSTPAGKIGGSLLIAFVFTMILLWNSLIKARKDAMKIKKQHQKDLAEQQKKEELGKF